MGIPLRVNAIPLNCSAIQSGENLSAIIQTINLTTYHPNLSGDAIELASMAQCAENLAGISALSPEVALTLPMITPSSMILEKPQVITRRYSLREYHDSIFCMKCPNEWLILYHQSKDRIYAIISEDRSFR